MEMLSLSGYNKMEISKKDILRAIESSENLVEYCLEDIEHIEGERYKLKFKYDST